MAKKQDENRYIVVERDKITREEKPLRVTTSLSSLQKKHLPFGTLEDFERMALSGETIPMGVTVTIASDEELKKRGAKQKLLQAAHLYAVADDIAKQTKDEGALLLMEHVSKNVETQDEIESFMNIYGVSSTSLMAMHKVARKQGIEPTPEFVENYTKLVAARSKKTGNERTVQQVRIAWDAEPKEKKKANA